MLAHDAAEPGRPRQVLLTEPGRAPLIGSHATHPAPGRAPTATDVGWVAAVWFLAFVVIASFAKSQRPPERATPAATVLQIPLERLPDGVSYHEVAGTPIFVVSLPDEGYIDALLGYSTRDATETIAWCPGGYFAGTRHGGRWDVYGDYLSGPAPRDLDRVRVRVGGGSVRVDPGHVIRAPGRSAPDATSLVGTSCTGEPVDGIFRH